MDCSKEVKWDGEAFKKMKNLKTLIIRHATFSKSPSYLPNSVRVLEWCEYPSSDLPPGFYPEKLVICNFGSNFTSNPFEWEDFLQKASLTYYLYLLSHINKSSLRLLIHYLFICMFFHFLFCFFSEVPEYESFKF